MPKQTKPSAFYSVEYKIHSLWFPGFLRQVSNLSCYLWKSSKERIRYYTIQLYCVRSQQSPLTKGLLPSWVVGKKGRGGKNGPRSLLSLMEPESRGSSRCSVWFVLWHLVSSQWAGAVCLAALSPFYLPTERKKDGKTLCDPTLDRRPLRLQGIAEGNLRWPEDVRLRSHTPDVPDTCGMSCDDGGWGRLPRQCTDRSLWLLPPPVVRLHHASQRWPTCGT